MNDDLDKNKDKAMERVKQIWNTRPTSPADKWRLCEELAEIQAKCGFGGVPEYKAMLDRRDELRDEDKGTMEKPPIRMSDFYHIIRQRHIEFNLVITGILNPRDMTSDGQPIREREIVASFLVHQDEPRRSWVSTEYWRWHEAPDFGRATRENRGRGELADW
jgi:hypothetical protein